jgi:hypothetical protein
MLLFFVLLMLQIHGTVASGMQLLYFPHYRSAAPVCVEFCDSSRSTSCILFGGYRNASTNGTHYSPKRMSQIRDYECKHSGNLSGHQSHHPFLLSTWNHMVLVRRHLLEDDARQASGKLGQIGKQTYSQVSSSRVTSCRLPSSV